MIEDTIFYQMILSVGRMKGSFMYFNSIRDNKACTVHTVNVLKKFMYFNVQELYAEKRRKFYISDS